VSILRNHAVLMVIFSTLTGAFFALLWKSEAPDRIRVFAFVRCGLLPGGPGLARARVPFPR